MRCLTEITAGRYLDGELDRAGEQEVREHAAACARCRDLLDRLGEENRLITVTLDVEAGGEIDIRDLVRQRLQEEDESVQREDRVLALRHPWRLRLAAGLAVLVLALTAFVVFIGRGPAGTEREVQLCAAKIKNSQASEYVFVDTGSSVKYYWLERNEP